MNAKQPNRHEAQCTTTAFRGMASANDWPLWYKKSWVFCRDLSRLLNPIRVNLIILALLAVALWFPDQSHDLFVALADDLRAQSWQIEHMAIAASVLGLAMWFTSASLLLHCGHGVSNTRFNRIVQQSLPPVLGATPFLIVAAAFHFSRKALTGTDPVTARLQWAIWLLIAAGAVLGALCAALGSKLEGLPEEHASSSFLSRAHHLLAKFWSGARRFTAVQKFVWSSIVSLILIIIAVSVFTPRYAAQMGPGAVVLMAALFWCFFFHPVVLLCSRYRVRLLTILGVAALSAGLSDCNDNHAVRTLNKGPLGALPDSTRALNEWLVHQRGKDPLHQPFPVFLVAAEGGGIRNAYWTALVLAHLADRYPTFKQHVFAVSGVSGGSVGAVVYAALIRAEELPGKTHQPLVPRAQAILAEDMLSPVLARAAIPDGLDPIFGPGRMRAEGFNRPG